MGEDNSNSGNSGISLSGRAIALAITDDDSLAAALVDSGMKMRDIIVLSFISDQGPVTASYLARLLGLEIQETTGCIGRLVAAGLVFGDESVVVAEEPVVATDAGKAVAAKILSVM